MAQLRQRMDVSPAAITYLVDRMIDAGHVRRESDPADRRKALLRYEESGMELAVAAQAGGVPAHDLNARLLFTKYSGVFSAAYREAFSPGVAVDDIGAIEWGKRFLDLAGDGETRLREVFMP